MPWGCPMLWNHKPVVDNKCRTSRPFKGTNYDCPKAAESQLLGKTTLVQQVEWQYMDLFTTSLDLTSGNQVEKRMPWRCNFIAVDANNIQPFQKIVFGGTDPLKQHHCRWNWKKDIHYLFWLSNTAHTTKAAHAKNVESLTPKWLSNWLEFGWFVRWCRTEQETQHWEPRFSLGHI